MNWQPIPIFVTNYKFGYQTANLLREDLITLASRRAVYPLGGSREIGLPQVALPQNAVNWLDIEFDGSNFLIGMNLRLHVNCRTANPATSVTPRLRNITDGSDAAVGLTCSATNADYSGANQVQMLAVTLGNGIKRYRLQGTPSNTTNPTFVIGYLEVFATQ